MHEANEDLYFIKGDTPDPEGSGLMGQEYGVDMTATALCKPLIRWDGADGGRVLEADVYEMAGKLLVHLICPVCENGLHVRQGQKEIRLSGQGWRRKISISKFKCTHPAADGTVGNGCCPWSVEIVDNVARDVR